jgi:hypothetical protein
VQNIGRITKSNISVSGGTGTAHILVQGPGRINDIPNDVGDEDIIAAASATNYTPTGSTVEGHLAGIDTALGAISDTDDQTAAEVSVAASPSNYTAGTADVEAHLAGIDTALAGAGGYTDAEAIAAVEGEATLALTGAVTVASTLTVDTDVLHVDVTNDRVGIGTTTPEADLNVVSAATGNIFVLECTDAGATSGPDISLVRDSSTPADDDFLGRIVFKGRDDGGNLLEYGNIKAQLGDASNGSEGFNMFFQGVIAGTNRAMLNLRANDGLAGASQAEVCVNEHGIDMDFRVETDNDTAALFVQGSSDSVGISTTSPVATLDVQSGKTFRVTRLLTVSLSSTTTLNEASHGGRYVFVTGSSTTINLPGTHAAGLHFTLLSNDANGFTLASTDNMNGSASNITVDARNGVTCISDGTDWVVLGA